jgi:hypothetical protein
LYLKIGQIVLKNGQFYFKIGFEKFLPSPSPTPPAPSPLHRQKFGGSLQRKPNFYWLGNFIKIGQSFFFPYAYAFWAMFGQFAKLSLFVVY